MRLTVLDRLLLLNLLPVEGSFVNLKLLRVAREELSFNEEENKSLNFRQEGDQMVWKDMPVIMKEVNLGEVVSDLIVKALEKLDKEEKLRAEHMSVCEKFLPTPEDDK